MLAEVYSFTLADLHGLDAYEFSCWYRAASRRANEA